MRTRSSSSGSRSSITGSGWPRRGSSRRRFRRSTRQPRAGFPCSRVHTERMVIQPKRSTTRNLGRISEIAQVAVKHGFGYFFERHRLTDLLPWGAKVLTVERERSQRGQHLREMFDELGPTFVKFGQLLSTRPDIVPPDIIAELRKLQDDVTPFPYTQVEQVIEAELGLAINKLFVEFSEKPLAAASIGQVHEALLPNGRRVAVKVQRPNAPRQIEADLALLY